MPRKRRYYISNMPHELCLRVREALPFPCWILIELLLKSAMARSSRMSRVTICHFLWMANHLHMLLVIKDAEACERFYGELQKTLTDYVKRLTGLKHLSLWEGRPMVAPILDPVKVAQRICYLYSNPAKADLVNSITEYPGFSSWKCFQASDAISATYSMEVPWIHSPSIKRLQADILSQAADKALAAELIAGAQEMETLELKPNAWGNCFSLCDSDMAQLNRDIKESVSEEESNYAKGRKAKGRKALGAIKLRNQPFYKRHTPKKKERKIFVLSSVAELRIKFIDELRRLGDHCAELYALRLFHLWPPGMFRPPAPPIASALYCS